MNADTTSLSIKIRSVTFVGVKTANFEGMSQFVAGLGLALKNESEDFRAYSTPDGTRFEIFGANYPGKDHFDRGVVVGFEVEDIQRSRDWIDARGLEVLEDVTSTSGTRWIHFRGPDGNVYEFVRHPEFYGVMEEGSQ